METTENNMESHCYCAVKELEDYMITCNSCKKKFHPTCLKSGRPSQLAGDIYFIFTCQKCAPDGVEIVKRMKMQWTLVIMLALYNLQLEESGKCGYFRWREHICRYIDKHWIMIFGADRKKTNTWHGTVAGALSTGANRFFLSGVDILGENGWWSLKSSRMPAIEELDSIALNLKANRKRKTTSEPEQTVVEGSRRKNQNIVEAAVALKEKKSNIADTDLKPIKIKREGLDPKIKNELSLFPPNHRLKFIVDSTSCSSQHSDENSNQSFSRIAIKTEPEEASSDFAFPFENPNFEPHDFDMDLLDSLDVPDSFLDDMSEISSDIPSTIKQEDENGKLVGTPKKSFPDTARKRTVVTKEESPSKDATITTESKFSMISVSEEEIFLKKLENYPTAMRERPEVRQFYRKLAVRKLKREHNLPVFDIDAEVRALRGMDPPDYINDVSKYKKNANNSVTIFDRFQSTKNTYNSQEPLSFIVRLMGKNLEQMESIVSPYSGRILKPFIFRDYKTKPLKVRLLEEILMRSNKNNKDWVPPEQYPIDYCYVRPEFIPNINMLCHEFFWPGIDMQECLQYPDFSCVALYRKVIVGFAFMVPDVSYNEAYITFIFCHPEWRKCGIAKFMLYHLIQTCMGRDITLHVSATSSAVFLYQKFCFKIEEIIHDFYDNYLPADSKECRHALKLRLTR